MDIKKLEKVIELLKANQLAEIDVTLGKYHVRVVANQQRPELSIAPNPYLPMTPVGYSAGYTAHSPVLQDKSAVLGDSKKDAPAIKGHEVRSPFVGTYYSASSPGSDPFVKVGDRVKKGQTLCIVEAMKLMNEIEADREGVIQKIFLKNEDTVEFDQTLFVIE